MTRRYTLLLAGAAFALAASAGAAAWAEAAPAAGPQAKLVRKGDTEIRIERDGGNAVFIRRERHEDMAAHLRAVLQLKPGQEAALAAYVQALKPKPGAMMRLDSHDGPMATPQRLDRMEKMMTEHEAMMHARIEATRRFYAQLDPAQQKAFDELGLAGGHMGMMRVVRFHGPMGMPPMPPLPPPPAPQAPGL